MKNKALRFFDVLMEVATGCLFLVLAYYYAVSSANPVNSCSDSPYAGLGYGVGGGMCALPDEPEFDYTPLAVTIVALLVAIGVCFAVRLLLGGVFRKDNGLIKNLRDLAIAVFTLAIVTEPILRKIMPASIVREILPVMSFMGSVMPIASFLIPLLSLVLWCYYIVTKLKPRT